MKIDRKGKTEHEESGRTQSSAIYFPHTSYPMRPKISETSGIFTKGRHGFDRDYKLLSPVHSSQCAGGCLPVVGICNSQNETVNYFSSKISKPLPFTSPDLPFCQSGGLANTEENRTRNGRGLIFAASNPQDELRYVTMCYRII